MRFPACPFLFLTPQGTPTYVSMNKAIRQHFARTTSFKTVGCFRSDIDNILQTHCGIIEVWEGCWRHKCNKSLNKAKSNWHFRTIVLVSAIPFPFLQSKRKHWADWNDTRNLTCAGERYLLYQNERNSVKRARIQVAC